MRILLATDGSRSADMARDMAARLPWPDGSTIRIVAGLERRAALFGGEWLAPGGGELDGLESELIRHAEVTLDDAERVVARPGLTIQRLLLRGRPASAIVDEAREWKADLVIVGSRGHGPIATMVLGSTSAEVVDHAPCPVLVVRRDSPGEIVFADDGSTGAEHAEAVLTQWPIFQDLPVTVLSVADVSVPWAAAPAPGVYDRVLEAYTVDVDRVRDEVNRLASDTAAGLRQLGIAATSAVREGDPAHEIVEFARERGAAIVVIGTRGQTGLTRFLLGSVARNVLEHAPCSVLVVREKVEVHPEPRSRDETLVSSGG